MWLSGPPAAAQVDGDAARETVRAVLDEGGYQRSMPIAGETRGDDGQTRLERRATHTVGGSDGPSTAAQLVADARKGPFASFAEATLWLVLAVAAVLFLFRLWQFAARWRRSATAAAPVTTRADEATVPDDPLGHADGLAAAGAPGEAVQSLLRAAIHQLRRRRQGGALRSWTVRESARRVPMPHRARAALGILVESAERDHYGGRPAVAATYRACRSCYLRFLAMIASSGHGTSGGTAPP